ncbi:collagen alpha-6(VI) chain-like [Sardina pilchardus]|uniref:collagen alpha-6(VI) chain-like n=1 Tax=Sardina pilchardus TaxID=27697 RepID=UPI002E0FFE01
MMNPLPLLLMVALSGYSTAAPTGCSTATQVVQVAADVVFLLNGSGSVAADQFLIMKTLVKNMTRSLLPYDTLFAFAQYSSSFTTHVNFNQFDRTTFESQVNSIVQTRGGTYPTWDMGKVVQEMLNSSVGARADAKRFLIVITDGQSCDSASYPSVAAQADASNITRYTIGVSSAEHMFNVTNFGGLQQIRKSLEKKLLTIKEGIVNCPNQGNQTCPPTSSNSPTQAADIVFLLDGSTSVKADQFILMKGFVKNLTRRLLPYDTLFAFAQYSDQMTKHVNFNEFNRTGFENQVDSIVQRQGHTHTGYAVEKVKKYIFHAYAGARPSAKKVLIIITDGQSYDASRYPSVAAKADIENITRYAIGLGSASQIAKKQLRAIASKPESDHVFVVDNFDADTLMQTLSNISKALENELIVFDTQVVPTVNGNAEGAPCVFPFVYLGTSYSTCTTLNHDKPWCSTTSNFDEDELWGECCIQDGE